MTILEIRHRTVYRYRQPVRFGEHRLMFRPRDSHDLRLIGTGLQIDPPAKVRWLHDVFSNSVAIATFTDTAAELHFDSQFKIEHYGLEDPDFPIEEYASTYPVSYPTRELPDLARLIERTYSDPKRELIAWARSFLDSSGQTDTQELLARMTRAVKAEFRYEERQEEGTQDPVTTLRRNAGTCRDFALLMMEGARSLSLAARFVTGYLYDPALDGASSTMQGAGSTHAWVQVYLPGAGWVEFDPTNGLVGGRNLIRVAVARDPAQAVPLSGSYDGAPEDFLGMEVEVSVSAAF